MGSKFFGQEEEGRENWKFQTKLDSVIKILEEQQKEEYWLNFMSYENKLINDKSYTKMVEKEKSEVRGSNEKMVNSNILNDNRPTKRISILDEINELKGSMDSTETKIEKIENQTKQSSETLINKLSSIYSPPQTMDDTLIISENSKKKYSSSWFYGQNDTTFPTIEEQVELCRKIAAQLVNDENRESKGASMFYKRVKRAPKWVHQSGVNSDDASLSEDETKQIEAMKQRLRNDERKPLKLILDPREIKTVEKLRKLGGSFTEHNAVSPDVCLHLVKDLNSPEINKGALIFLKRKEKSAQWIVDENEASKQIRENKERQEKEKERPKEKIELVDRFSSSIIKPRIKLVRSPWEAALTGNVDDAFVNLSADPLAQNLKEAAYQKKWNELYDSNKTFSKQSSFHPKYSTGLNTNFNPKLYLPRVPKGWQSQEPRKSTYNINYQENIHSKSWCDSSNRENISESLQKKITNDIQQQQIIGANLKSTKTFSMPRFRNFNTIPKGYKRQF